MYGTNDIRELFQLALRRQDFVIDKTGTKTIEINAAQFVADSPRLFGEPNHDWHRRELAWYLSKSLNVNDIEEPIPAIWKQVADKNGFINSNYGWCVFSEENGNQYMNVLNELMKTPDSRRAQMIYTRPSMWNDYNKNGRSDFMCTSNTQHVIRKDKLMTMVYMRSNDAVMGYKGDYAWFSYVHQRLAEDLKIEPGDIIWHAGSLHVYSRHFYLVDPVIYPKP